MIRIGIIEDNLDFRTELVFHLQRTGFDIAFESDGRDVDLQISKGDCDIVLLDLTLPHEDGLDIARRLRNRHPHIGIVILTERNTQEDRIGGLRQGADAYFGKPVDMRELIATIETIHRRLHRNTEKKPPRKSWSLDRRELKLTSPQGKSIPLSVNELKLLEALGTAQGSPVSRKALAAAIGCPGEDFDERRLEVTFSRLRQKIESIAQDADLIRAARGLGYLLATNLDIR